MTNAEGKKIASSTCPTCRRAVTPENAAAHSEPPCAQCKGIGDHPPMCRMRCDRCHGVGHESAATHGSKEVFSRLELPSGEVMEIAQTRVLISGVQVWPIVSVAERFSSAVAREERDPMAQVREAAKAEERAAIVAFLRRPAKGTSYEHGSQVLEAIAAGEHTTTAVVPPLEGPDDGDRRNARRLLDAARGQERAAVVAWLREQGRGAFDPALTDYVRAADAIERGAHQTPLVVTCWDCKGTGLSGDGVGCDPHTPLLCETCKGSGKGGA